MNLDVHTLARADFNEYVADLITRDVRLDLVLAVVTEVERAFALIRQHPNTWSFAKGSRRVRKVQVRRFRLQVFYQVLPDGTPLVLEIAAPGRLPRWRERL
jgi:hypothetical protein